MTVDNPLTSDWSGPASNCPASGQRWQSPAAQSRRSLADLRLAHRNYCNYNVVT